MKLSQAQIAMLARTAGLPGDPNVWAAIAMAESGGDTKIVNSIGCVGLWQINQPVWVKSHPSWTVAWLQNPLNNALAAKTVYKAQGFGAWEAYTGKDGTGSDGPWRKYANGASTAATLPAAAEGVGMTDSLSSLGTIADGVKRSADMMANPRFWLRVAYGTTGVFLVAGGLFLMVKNTAVTEVVGTVGKSVMKGS